MRAIKRNCTVAGQTVTLMPDFYKYAGRPSLTQAEHQRLAPVSLELFGCDTACRGCVLYQKIERGQYFGKCSASGEPKECLPRTGIYIIDTPENRQELEAKYVALRLAAGI